MLRAAELELVLHAVRASRVAVIGDFAIDAYWDLDAAGDEVSLETGAAVRRVARQRYAPGGAGNVVANLRALGVERVRAIGVAGDDPFGAELRAALQRLGVDATGIVDGGGHWQTTVFAKPHQDGVEQNRIDFGTRNALDAKTAARLADALERAVADGFAVLFNQQIAGTVMSPVLIELANACVARSPQRRFLVDARDAGAQFRGVARKLNAHEARVLCGEPSAPRAATGVAQGRALLAALDARGLGTPLFLTLGADGMLVADGARMHELGAVPIDGPIDPVGAGDTVAAALIAVLASGGEPLLAARLATLAAAVTVRKLRQTGTASPAEILALAAAR